MRIPSETLVHTHKVRILGAPAIIGVVSGVVLVFALGITLGLRLAAPNNARANRELMKFFSSRNRR